MNEGFNHEDLFCKNVVMRLQNNSLMLCDIEKEAPRKVLDSDKENIYKMQPGMRRGWAMSRDFGI